MKVLTVGIGSEILAKAEWPKSTLKTTTLLQFPRGWGRQYDKVFAYQALQRVSNAAVITTLKNWYHVLKPGGMLYVFVPSWEWSSRQGLAEEPAKLAIVNLCGPQSSEDTFWLSIFSMRRLRIDMDDAGFKVKEARTIYYSMIVAGQDEKAEQHYVVGEKPDA